MSLRFLCCFIPFKRLSSLLPFTPQTLTLTLTLTLPPSSSYCSTASPPPPSSSETETVAGVFLRWGCTAAEVSQILRRHPSLHRISPSALRSKLEVLTGIGMGGPDLSRIIACRPRFLYRRAGQNLDRRLDFLKTLFDSQADLVRVIVRNPSLLNYEVDRTIQPCVTLYESVGVDRRSLGRLLISRPTVVSRSSLDEQKLGLIRRTRLPPTAPMYKYVVSIVAVSRIETIQSKIGNLEKFGFTEDEVMGLFAKTPNVLTLSVEKVQRNMTYITTIMKLLPRVVLEMPFLLYANLEKVLKSRHSLGLKLREMGLEPQLKGPALAKAMRMKEPRFLKVYVLHHKGDDADALMEFYTRTKESKRLAESARSDTSKGFPF